MRILFLSGEHPDVPGLTGGIGSFVADASQALAGAGHDVHVLVCAPDLAHADQPREGVWVHARGVVGALRVARGRVARQAAIAASCRWHARGLGRFDVIEAPEWQALGAGFAVRRSTPLVVTLQTPSAVVAAHGPESAPARANDFMERWVVRRAGVVFSLSQLLVDELRRTGWLHPSTRVEVVPPVAHVQAWVAGDVAAGRPRLVGVGRLEPRKGFDLLIDAAALLLSDVPDLTVEIAGAAVGDEGERLAAAAERSGVRLRLLGRVARAELPQLLGGAAAVVLPSTFDSFNIAGLEALAAGVPVVLSEHVGLGELDDGSGALRIVARRADSLADAIRPLLLDDDVRAFAGTAAHAVARRCSPERFAAARSSCYEALA